MPLLFAKNNLFYAASLTKMTVPGVLNPLSHVSTLLHSRHSAVVPNNHGYLWTVSHISSSSVHDLAPFTAALVTTAPIWKRHGTAPRTP